MRLQEAFSSQSHHCAALGSPFMGRLMALCAAHWPDDGAVARCASEWPGDLGPKSASLPLRIAGGLHALVLSNQAPDLAAVYPPSASSDEALWEAVQGALTAHEAFLLNWIENAPQTNEVRRSAALIPAAHMLAERFGLPLRLSELGASGGLNLNFDRFNLQAGETTFGPQSDVWLSPEWRGPTPTPAILNVAERRGVDLTPLDPTQSENALRLMAYLWPDQSERLTRTRAAIALPAAKVDQNDAVTWLKARLPHQAGSVHMIYSTIAWQYFPTDKQTEGRSLIEKAGALATETTPLAWVAMEADTETRGAALTIRLWPGDIKLALARVDFHGRWLDWEGPTALPPSQ